MTSTLQAPEPAVAGAFVPALREEISKVLVGQHDLVQSMLICLLTGNHLLVEGLPGLAKTLAVTTLAKALSADHARIQFTPDLLPSDVIGSHIYNPGTQTFISKPGPVFTNLLLADEINRAPAKVQSSLLEAMQERQVTLGGVTQRLPNPFLVIATQNPLDQEGTYPLPEAQTDRFMMKAIVRYPSRDEEAQVLRRMSSTLVTPTARPVATLEDVAAARKAVDEVRLDEKIEEYILDLVLATRVCGRKALSARQDGIDLSFLEPLLAEGASPRATLTLARGARALAFLNGRNFVLPEDVKTLAPDILRHRLALTYEAQAENMDADSIIQRLLGVLRAP